jgi:hypothetical protein
MRRSIWTAAYQQRQLVALRDRLSTLAWCSLPDVESGDDAQRNYEYG